MELSKKSEPDLAADKLKSLLVGAMSPKDLMKFVQARGELQESDASFTILQEAISLDNSLKLVKTAQSEKGLKILQRVEVKLGFL